MMWAYLTARAFDLLKPLLIESEGLRLKAYLCPAGKLTIGYGHTGPDVTPGMEIKHKRAEELLMQDVTWVDRTMAETLKVELGDHQKAAVASLIYNIGAGAWRGSTMLKRLNRADLQGAAEALTWWNKVTKGDKKVTLPGLVARREKERALFMTGVTPVVIDEAPPTPGTISGGEQKKPTQSWTNRLAGLGLATMLVDAAGYFQQIKEAAPEVVQHYGMHIVIGTIVICIILRRLSDMRKGDR